MTRQEQIINAAEIFVRPISDHSGDDATRHDDDCRMFQAGAEWADRNAWRMCSEVLPERKCQQCICTDGKDIFFADWVDDTPKGLSGWDINGVVNCPIAWMPIPEITKPKLL